MGNVIVFSKDKRSRLQVETGVISILHTWTQKLEYHPHLHCIVPAGGLTAAGKWKAKQGDFLFSVKALSVVFKNKFCDALQLLYRKNNLNFNNNKPVDQTEFIVFIKNLKKKSG